MKLATIGSGVIVDQFVDACRQVANVEVVACYSRSQATANEFAAKHAIPHAFADLDTLLASDLYDTLYVASPNSLHYEQTKKAILAHKHVIVEKPFASHDRESKELIELSKIHKVFLFEAMSINHMPNLAELKKRMVEIEPIKWVELSMCQYSSKFNAFKSGELPNVFNPAFSGGALMDLNIYHLNFLLELFGQPKIAHYIPQKADNGIDVSGVMLLHYPNMLATAVSTKDSMGRPFGVLHGEKGMIEFTQGVNGLRSFTLTQGKSSETVNVQTQENRLVYEVEAFEAMLRNHDVKAMHAGLDKTQERMELLTKLRQDAGIRFSADKL